MEKAFAKHLGGYAKLEGGMPLFALEAMTGDLVAHFKVERYMDNLHRCAAERCAAEVDRGNTTTLSPEQHHQRSPPPPLVS